jgi:hypothetical protein
MGTETNTILFGSAKLKNLYVFVTFECIKKAAKRSALFL